MNDVIDKFINSLPLTSLETFIKFSMKCLKWVLTSMAVIAYKFHIWEWPPSLMVIYILLFAFTASTWFEGFERLDTNKYLQSRKIIT